MKLTRDSRLKLKCLNIQTGGADPNSSTGSLLNWASVWNTSTDAAFQAFWNAAISCALLTGSNATKWNINGLPDFQFQLPGGSLVQYPSDAVLRARLQWVLQQHRLAHLLAYINLANLVIQITGPTGTSLAANLPTISKIVRWLDQDGHDVIVGIDVLNEVNYNAPATWGGALSTATTLGNKVGYNGGATSNMTQAAADLTSLMATCRSATTLPLTFSVLTGSTADYSNNAFLALQTTLGCDYHDFHPYSGTTITATDLSGLESRSIFLGRHLMGENGVNLKYLSGTLGQTFMQQLGQMASRRLSLGGVMFCANPYVPIVSPPSADLYEIFDSSFANVVQPVAYNGYAGWLGSALK